MPPSRRWVDGESTAEALAGELQAAGIDLGPDGADRLEDVLDGSSEFVELDDGWVGVAAQLDGTRWITKVDADEAKVGRPPARPGPGAARMVAPRHDLDVGRLG